VLDELHIRDVGVLDDVTLPLGPGLTVVTGETGAGKTMVVSALELLRGARADSDQVRRGASAALVEGRLRPPPPGAEEWLGEGDDELVVAREVAAGGRSRARLSGRLAPVSALASLVGGVVELHGQSDNARLSSPAAQRELLDRSGGPRLAALLEDYRATHRALRAAEQELEALQHGERDRVREVGRLEFELGEIDAVDPQPGEEDELDAELRRLEHAESLVAAAATAAATLADDGGARDALGAAVAALRGSSGYDAALDELLARAEGLAAEAQDLAFELSGYAGGIEADPERLAGLRDRRMALGALLRKYGPDTQAVRAYAVEARARLETLAGGDERRTALEAETKQLRDALAEQGRALAERRRAAGTRLAKAVEGHLAELAMAAARMSVEVAATEPGPDGADRVTFLLAANPGEPALPLGKAASGGERSRVALAVRLALADADATPVLVFDEVDAGIGGATALAVGRKLARLARGRQVLCVTHLAQLAAFADAHVVVAKRTARGRTVAQVRVLQEAERVAELSRMLSGTPDSAAAARHAAELRALGRERVEDR
jgi:DNA repair protein RecN (Recombination protein N)